MKRTIKKVAVLGSGVMGSRIACHFAGVGLQVLLLDLAPETLLPAEVENSLTLQDKKVKNRVVDTALAAAIKSSPSPLYYPEADENITTGNFTDDLPQIAYCDWIIEVIVESPAPKQALFAQVEQHRKAGTLVTTNTSGIPIHVLASGRTSDFKAHFCGTHFFNPPRYLPLLEIIPAAETKPEVIEFLLHYATVYLGKTVVLAKDTPAFIANRIGVFSIMLVFKLMEKYKLTIEEVDFLTGPLIGRPKSATFRTADVVGIDTLVKVAKGVAANCKNDEAAKVFTGPAWLNRLVEKNWLGDKTGQGFYKKLPGKNAPGESVIEVLDPDTLTYRAKQKARFTEFEQARLIDDLPRRLKALISIDSNAGKFLQELHLGLFSYVSHRIPEITDSLYQVDEAMTAGFGWEMAPFALWDALQPATTLAHMDALGYAPALWVRHMLQNGFNTFYNWQNEKQYYYNTAAGSYKPLDSYRPLVVLSNFTNKVVFTNNACRVVNIGDDVLAIEWKTKMNTIGGDVLAGLNTAISLAEKDYRGLVIANEGTNFSAGANVALIFMLAAEQEYDELDLAVRHFQSTMLRLRYSAVPVVAAPHGLTLGGGCEVILHADKVCAAAETYLGLVETGVGLIPAGGGTKEMVARAAISTHANEPEANMLTASFFTIATAQVSTSAHLAYNTGILRKGKDNIVNNPQLRITEAKQQVVGLSQQYVCPVAKKIRVLGRSALGALQVGIHSMHTANYATAHDVKVATKLAYVMCGGDLSEPTLVPEQYLLDLEREAFLSLCGERKTLERLQSVLKTGKPIRN